MKRPKQSVRSWAYLTYNSKVFLVFFFQKPFFLVLFSLLLSYQLSHHVCSDASKRHANPHHRQDHSGCHGDHLSLQIPSVHGRRMALLARAGWHLADPRPRAYPWRYGPVCCLGIPAAVALLPLLQELGGGVSRMRCSCPACSTWKSCDVPESQLSASHCSCLL